MLRGSRHWGRLDSGQGLGPRAAHQTLEDVRRHARMLDRWRSFRAAAPRLHAGCAETDVPKLPANPFRTLKAKKRSGHGSMPPEAVTGLQQFRNIWVITH